MSDHAEGDFSETDADRGAGVEGGGIFGTGPETDEEMPLADHIEEMVRRLAVVAFTIAVVALFAYPISEWFLDFPVTDTVINHVWDQFIPNADPHLYSPPELLFTRIKTASLAGVIVALPVFVYQTYRFMRPGLYPNERRYYLAAVPTSLVLAFVGVSFAYFVLLPFVFAYFNRYTEQVTQVAFALGRTFDLILVLMGYLAVIFQIPLFIMLALMLNVVSREWMVQRRLLFWGGFAGLAFLFVGVDQTGVSSILIAITMIVLFEGTLLLAKWTGQ